MSTKPNIAVIIGTTRAARWGHVPAQWIAQQITQDGRMTAEVLDLADFDLPLFDEVASNKWAPSADPRARRWQEAIGRFDGYVFVTAEYNHSISGALKNALDQAFNEWNRKPAAIVGYGGLGAARAVEHLRGIAVELRMVNVADAVHIGGETFFKAHPMGGDPQPLEALDGVLRPSVDALIGELHWWAALLKDARRAEQAEAA